MWHSEESTEQQEIPWLLELSRLGSGVAIGEAKGLAYGWWWRRRRWVDQLETSVKKNERRGGGWRDNSGVGERERLE